MAETQRLTMWGWFVRAFAGGFGAMFGVMTALAVTCVFGYVMIAVGAMTLSSLGGVTINPGYATPVSAGGVDTAPWLTSTAECTPTTAQPYPVNEVAAPTATPTPNSSPYPYYTARGPADFQANQADEPATYAPAIGAEPAAYTPATAAEPADLQPVTSVESETSDSPE